MSLTTIAAAVESDTGYTVYTGLMPEALDGSYDECVCLFDYPAGRPAHDFGTAQPIITYYGLEVAARAKTEAAARTMCDTVYASLLDMGFLALAPPMDVPQASTNITATRPRYMVVAQVRAHEIRT